MEAYEALRGFAGSWGLLLLVAAFGVMLVWVFRPGARKAQDEAARQIFRNEDAPKKDEDDGR
jgi:cytochrome c oxidase cbb3-type subunit 4